MDVLEDETIFPAPGNRLAFGDAAVARVHGELARLKADLVEVEAERELAETDWAEALAALPEGWGNYLAAGIAVDNARNRYNTVCYDLERAERELAGLIAEQRARSWSSPSGDQHNNEFSFDHLRRKPTFFRPYS